MKLKLLTPAQQKVYEVIAQHVAETGRGLNFQAIGDKLGGRSSATIWKHIRNLVKLGMLKQSPTGRIIFISANTCPTCGHRKTEFSRSMKQSIRKGLATPISECRTESEWK